MVHKKRLWIACLTLALAVMLSCACGTAESGTSLPAAGDIVEGFVVSEVRDFPLLNAKAVLFQHEKTGAMVMYIANEDTNRVFETTFRTPTLNDMGVPHVFEHSTLDGSEKYPSKSLFFNLIYQTYNTYINAATYSHMTTFPIASLSEEQLLKFADYYTDSVFHPLSNTDESIFLEEAWRYELTDAEADLTIAGTVYSEMQGAYTVNRAARMNQAKTLFPGSNTSNNFGGTPDVIPNMTWADLCAYHEAYYHPSNSLTCLYGSFDDYGAFLALLNDYFSAYEKRDIVIANEHYAPISQPVTASFEYGVEAGSDTANGAVAYYGFVCEGATLEDYYELDLLVSLLNADSSKVMEALKDKLPTAAVSCYVDAITPEISVYFVATGMNPGEEETLKAVIDEALKETVESGFTREEIDAVVSSTQLSIMLTAEDSSVGVNMIPNIAYKWASDGNPFSYLDYIDQLDRLETMATDGSAMKQIEKYLIGNDRYALTLTCPVAGLKEEKDQALADQLASLKASMTEEEIAALVSATKAYSEEASDDSSEYIKQLQATTVESLPEEARLFDIVDTVGEDGVRRISAEAGITGVGSATVLLDASAMPLMYLHAAKLYTDLLAELDTDTHTAAQLSALINRYLYNGSIRVSVLEDRETRTATPYVSARWICLDEDLPEAYALVKELLLTTKLDNPEKIGQLVTKIKTSLKSTITNEAYNVMAYRAFAAKNDSYALSNYINYLDYYQFLTEAEQMFASGDSEAILTALRLVQEYLNCSTGAISGFAGSAESIALNEKASIEFFSGMSTEARERMEYEYPAIPASEALIIDSAVQYNLLYASFEDLGIDQFSGDLDAVTALVTDTFLYPLLRDQYGVYGVMHYAFEYGVYAISYRDPNIMETFQVYQSLPERIAAMTVDQETLNGYILSSYSAYAQSQGELTGAVNAIFNHINHIPQDEALLRMRELKSLTPDSFAAYAKLYQALADNGIVSTAGGASAIAAYEGMYENVLNPFGAVDATKVVFEDVPEGAPHYDAIRFAYENMLMSAATETLFGAENPATLGDIAVAMYALVGGSGDAETAIAFLSEYGILPAEAAKTELTNENMIVYTYNFAWAMGVDVESGLAEDLSGCSDADAIQGEDGQTAYLWAIGNGLYDQTEELKPASVATRAELAEIMTRFAQ